MKEPDGTEAVPGRAPRFRPDQEFELLAARGMTGTWTVIEGPEEWRTAEREWDESLTEILDEARARYQRIQDAGHSTDAFPPIPQEPGLYRLRLAFRFEPGFFEGYPASGECDWSFEPLSITPAAPTVEQGVASDLAAIVKLALDTGWNGKGGEELAEWLRERLAEAELTRSRAVDGPA